MLCISSIAGDRLFCFAPDSFHSFPYGGAQKHLRQTSVAYFTLMIGLLRPDSFHFL